MFASLFELLMMKIIWYLPISLKEMVQVTGLDENQVRDALEALEAKNMIWYDGERYTALTDKAEVQHLVDTLYGGDVASFVKQHSHLSLHHNDRELDHAS